MPSRRLKLRYLFLFLILPFEVRAFDRIVTLTPSLSEWTATLLGEAKAKKAIVGVSEFSQYPAYLKSVDLVGPYPKLAVEKIASLKPDLVLASAQANQHDQIEQLRRLRLNVQVLPVEKFSEMAEWIVNLGEILHEKKAAEAVQKEWIRGVNDLKRTQSKAPNKRYVLEVQHSPLIVVGSDRFLNEALAQVGYQNVFSNLSQAYPKVSKEAVLKENPDVIFILSMDNQESELQWVKKEWQAFPDLKATRKNQIRALSGDDYARCSLRLLKALKQLN